MYGKRDNRHCKRILLTLCVMWRMQSDNEILSSGFHLFFRLRRIFLRHVRQTIFFIVRAW